MLNYNYHSFFLKQIKKNTGCQYLAFENYKDAYQIRTVKNNQEEFFVLSGTPQDIKPENYTELENMIKERYE